MRRPRGTRRDWPVNRLAADGAFKQWLPGPIRVRWVFDLQRGSRFSRFVFSYDSACADCTFTIGSWPGIIVRHLGLGSGEEKESMASHS